VAVVKKAHKIVVAVVAVAVVAVAVVAARKARKIPCMTQTNR
jgi:hypothetical protein